MISTVGQLLGTMLRHDIKGTSYKITLLLPINSARIRQ